MQSIYSAFMFAHALCRSMHGFGLRTNTHIHGYVHLCFGCSVGFQKRVSQPFGAIFTGHSWKSSFGLVVGIYNLAHVPRGAARGGPCQYQTNEETGEVRTR